MTALEISEEFRALSPEMKDYVFGYFCGGISCPSENEKEHAEWVMNKLHAALLAHPRYRIEFLIRGGLRIWDKRPEQRDRPYVVAEFYDEETMVVQAKTWIKSHS